MGRTRVDRASAQDVMELALGRHSTVPMHLGALLVLDPSRAPNAVTLAAGLGERLAQVRRLRQRLVSVPPGCGRPVWVDDPRFAVDHHLETCRADGASTDAPGDALAQLAELVLAPLPPDLPLWRVRVLEDRSGRAQAVAVAVHHVLTDGIGALSILGAMVDGPNAGADTPDAAPVEARGPALPPVRVLVADAWGERARGVGRWIRGLGQARLALRELGARQVRLAEPSTLLQSTGPRRRVDVVDVELGPLLSAAHARGVTVNDLLLVALSGALRALLAHRGDDLATLVVSVPVSGRAGEVELGNVVGVLPVAIPLSADPDVRLRAVVSQRSRLGARGARGSSALLMTPLVRLLAALHVFQWLIRHQRLVHTFETNVRGPARSLAIAGCPVTAVVPLAVNPGNVSVSFDVLSTGGRIVVSIVSDPDHVPDHAVLREALSRELAVMAARGGPGRSHERRSASGGRLHGGAHSR